MFLYVSRSVVFLVQHGIPIFGFNVRISERCFDASGICYVEMELFNCGLNLVSFQSAEPHTH
jgi:hypothetical protein